MRARIFKPAKPATQSGTGKTDEWELEWLPEDKDIDPLMGWTSSADTQSQVRLSFASKEEALAYAEKHGIEAVVQPPQGRRPNIRPGGYGENFSTARREPWSH